MTFKTSLALAIPLAMIVYTGEVLSAKSGPIAFGSPLINYSSDPDALYGNCLAGGSTLGNKLIHLGYIGESLARVTAITVLRCQPFAFSAPHKIPCPAGSPYAYCINTGNDGLGNDVTLGILKLDKTTNPLGQYTGCAAGLVPKSKLRLVQRAGQEPREVKGIVTLSCGPATATSPVTPALVKCPPGPNPYGGYCIATPNDGFGNAVKIGVVKTVGAGDPYAVYGDCVTPRPGYLPGFLHKSDLVTSVGRSLENVRTIDLVSCTDHINLRPGHPTDHLEVTPCTNILPHIPIARYDYCIWGGDKHGNAIFAGVNTNN